MNAPILPLIVLFLFACKQPAEKRPSPDVKPFVKTAAAQSTGFDLTHPVKQWTLPPELQEISGLSPVDDTHFLVIEDLRPNLYLLNTAASTATIEKQVPFEQMSKEKVDIEDVTLHNDTAYALWSHGQVFRISNWRGQAQVKSFETPLSKEENTEGLCWDPASGKLLIACKNASGLDEEKKGTHAIYSFDTKTGLLDSTPFLLIHKKDFKKVAGEKLDFFPSAVAVQPGTNDVYILSSRENKLLAVYSHDGRLQTLATLDKALLPQPEGICFGNDGKLYISTQGKHGQPPMICAFAASKAANR